MFGHVCLLHQAAEWHDWLTAGWCAAGGHPPDKQSDSHWGLRAAKEQWTDQDQARLCYRGQVYRWSDQRNTIVIWTISSKRLFRIFVTVQNASKAVVLYWKQFQGLWNAVFTVLYVIVLFFLQDNHCQNNRDSTDINILTCWPTLACRETSGRQTAADFLLLPAATSGFFFSFTQSTVHPHDPGLCNICVIGETFYFLFSADV